MDVIDTILAIAVQDADESPERWSRDWWLELLVGTPLLVLAIVLGAFVLRWVAHRFIDRLADRVGRVDETPALKVKAAQVVLGDGSAFSERRALRATTMASMFKSITTAVIFTIALVMVLSAIGLDVAPIIASAGIVGIALGFGAQNLVKDFVSGIFMLLEDQYGVGDIIDTGFGAGVVEAVGLRVTRLRDVDGTVWYVRNGEVLRIGNRSQGWGRAVVDVGVRYGEDTARVRDVIARTAAELQADPEYSDVVVEDPEVWGVEQVSADTITMRVVVKTSPTEQWRVARALRERIAAAFESEGIEVPLPARFSVAPPAGPAPTA